jgi:formiminotetrahydrofolate cyclodeaminase
MKYMEKSCEEIVSIVASNAPVPGGGGLSALVGALGTALGNMVGSLTVGKKKYADVEADIIKLKERADQIQASLLHLVEDDVEVLDILLKAYAMPKSTPEEQEAKAEALEDALRKACQVPIDIMQKCCEAIDVIEGFAQKGSAMAISDAGVGAIFCKSALQGASLNVYINTKAMKDLEYAKDCNKKTEDMVENYGRKADEIFQLVREKLR